MSWESQETRSEFKRYNEPYDREVSGDQSVGNSHSTAVLAKHTGWYQGEVTRLAGYGNGKGALMSENMARGLWRSTHLIHGGRVWRREEHWASGSRLLPGNTVLKGNPRCYWQGRGEETSQGKRAGCACR